MRMILRLTIGNDRLRRLSLVGKKKRILEGMPETHRSFNFCYVLSGRLVGLGMSAIEVPGKVDIAVVGFKVRF